jgi:hypothetical protein
MYQDIKIMYGGKRYQVDSDKAYATDGIILPDGTILKVLGWHETFPPTPAGLRKVGKINMAIAKSVK